MENNNDEIDIKSSGEAKSENVKSFKEGVRRYATNAKLNDVNSSRVEVSCTPTFKNKLYQTKHRTGLNINDIIVGCLLFDGWNLEKLNSGECLGNEFGKLRQHFNTKLKIDNKIGIDEIAESSRQKFDKHIRNFWRHEENYFYELAEETLLELFDFLTTCKEENENLYVGLVRYFKDKHLDELITNDRWRKLIVEQEDFIQEDLGGE